ncbi:hypothetical protein [Tepidanaerobacter acetatoxydans]|uniref:hypothetical protein n=1 Tax=Tepidanaerobacter acetatoxydans TaxID=499229 RepID=UPI0026EDEAA6|nr:hypothetical protein [Tepidanaerobacter acetatoxydans]
MKSKKTDDIIKSALFWDIMIGVVRRVWADSFLKPRKQKLIVLADVFLLTTLK